MNTELINNPLTLFILDRCFYHFKGVTIIKLKDIKNYICKTYRIPNRISYAIVYNMLDNKYIDKKGPQIRFKSHIENEIEKSYNNIYMNLNKRFIEQFNNKN